MLGYDGEKETPCPCTSPRVTILPVPKGGNQFSKR
jgi:hypothetical protein